MSVERRPDGTTRGGQEPPDEVQDTPEQNAGYDAAVRGERSAEVADDEADVGAQDTESEGDAGERAAPPGVRRQGSTGR